MTRAKLWVFLVTAVLMSACAPDDGQLHVVLLTDLQPGAQFDRVEVALWPLGADGDLTTSGPARTVPAETVVFADAATLADEGLPVARFQNLEARRYVGEVALHSGLDLVVRNRFVVTYAGGDQVLPVHVDALCVGVDCPNDGPTSFIACQGGQCIDPRCFEEPEGEDEEGNAYCGTIEPCASPSTCEAIAECAAAVCLEGFCSSRPVAGACPDGEYCNVLAGCVPIPPPGAQSRCDTFCDPEGSPCHIGRLSCGRGTLSCEVIGFRRSLQPCDGGICDGLGTCVPCGADESPASCLATCPADREACGDGCVDIATSSTHCGACDRACGEGELCDAGACVATCGAGQAACDGGCHDLASSTDHCGDCGFACAAGEVCNAGACALECGGDTPTLCGRSCVDVTANRFHCDACGVRCEDGEVCVDSACATACPGGQIACGGGCVDPDSDREYCGSDPDCTGGEACVSGEVCVLGACETSCPATQLACDGVCVNPATDRARCGATDCASGATCADGELCVAGACAASCPPGQQACDGRCVDPETDRDYCGADATCAGGAACGSGEVCVARVCQLSCPSGQLACGGGCVDGRSDRVYCGAETDCAEGIACGAGEVCADGVCATSCPAAQLACGGACVDGQTDRAYCGAESDCAEGAVCGAGEVCGGGVCGPSCGAPLTACGGGCVDTRHDPLHCGACRAPCGPSHACLLGVCRALGGGFTGEHGPMWEGLKLKMDYGAFSDFTPREHLGPLGHDGGRSAVFQYPIAYVEVAMLPGAFEPHRTNALLGTGAWVVLPPRVAHYEARSGGWRLLGSAEVMGEDRGAMTITDGALLWTYAGDSLVSIDPVREEVLAYPVDLGRSPVAVRLGYDASRHRIFLGRADAPELFVFDIARREVTRRASIPDSRLGTVFCSDQSGHLYVAGQEDDNRMFQYSADEDAWTPLPDVPLPQISTCTVLEEHASLLVAARLGGPAVELPLTRY